MKQPRRSLRLAKTESMNVNTARMAQKARPGSNARTPGRIQSRYELDADSISPSDCSDAVDDDLSDDHDPHKEIMLGTVRHAGYRSHCLKSNNIHIQHPSIPLPSAIKLHWTRLSRLMLKTPKPPPDTVASAMAELEELGLQCTELKVVGFLGRHIFPGAWGGRLAQGLQLQDAMPMGRHLLPLLPTARFPVQQPRPDTLYGYSEDAFTLEQLATLTALYPEPPFDLVLPFFAIECKAAAGTGGSLWAATNQCAGASAACLQAAAYLNNAGRSASRVSNVCHSVAVDNHLAFLYVSWMDDSGRFYMQRVESFFLLRPDDFVRFHQHVQAILKWGAETRLDEMRAALDQILKARREEEREDQKDEPEPKRQRRAELGRTAA